MTDNATLAQEPTADALGNPLKRYFLATRPAFLLASLVPCLVGIASAYMAGVDISWILALLTVLGALLFHAAANVLNDYYDALNGTDDINTTRIYPFTGGSRFIQNGVLSRAQTARFGFALLFAGILLGLLLLQQSGTGLLWLGLAGTLLAWAYSAPPLSLNSRGLGELSIGIAFGLLPVIGSDYVQRGEFALLPLLVAIPYGLLASGLLYINQFPDREADARAGKQHLVVRIGVQRARWGYLVLVLTANLYLLSMVATGFFSVWMLMPLLMAPTGLLAAMMLLKYATSPGKLAPAIRLSIVTVIVHGLLLALGLVASK